MSECVVLGTSFDRKGYARAYTSRFGRRINGRHVLAWVDANGRLPGEGKVIMHTCDNPPCENEEHLVEGTNRDNLRDMTTKGRNAMTNKTCCPSGHAYTPENTYRWRNSRHCRTCRRAHDARRKMKKKELAG